MRRGSPCSGARRMTQYGKLLIVPHSIMPLSHASLQGRQGSQPCSGFLRMHISALALCMYALPVSSFSLGVNVRTAALCVRLIAVPRAVWVCRYEIYAISRPATLLALASYPLTRHYQRRFRRESIKAVREAATR